MPMTQLRLIKQVVEAENIDEKRFPARTLAALIDNWKNRGLTPDDVPTAKHMPMPSDKA